MKKSSLLALMAILFILPELYSQNIGVGLSVLNVRNSNDFSFTMPGVRLMHEGYGQNVFSTIYVSGYLPMRVSHGFEMRQIWNQTPPLSLNTKLSIFTTEFGGFYNYYLLGKPGEEFAFGAFAGGSLFMGKKKFEWEEYDENLYGPPHWDEDWHIYMFLQPQIGLVYRHKVKSGDISYRLAYNMGMDLLQLRLRDDYLFDFNSFILTASYTPSEFRLIKKKTRE